MDRHRSGAQRLEDSLHQPREATFHKNRDQIT